jgi:hypothetical protein
MPVLLLPDCWSVLVSPVLRLACVVFAARREQDISFAAKRAGFT